VTASHLAQQLTQLSTALLEGGHAMDAQTHKAVPDGAARTTLVTWSTPLPNDAAFPHDQFATMEEYLFFLDHRQFSLVLNDGALLQASYRLKGHEVVWHRLAFIPCPVIFSLEEMEGVVLSDFIAALSPADILQRISLQSAIRFDYDPLKAGPQHPASHATLNRACCRIPVRAPLQLRGFVRFVFSNFYPSLWESEMCLHAIGDSRHNTCITEADLTSMHIHWHP